MASSDGWLFLASQEAVRVEEQAKNIWSALKSGLGEDHGKAYQAALENANQAFGPVGPHSQPAERLAHASALLKQAKEHQARLVTSSNSLE
jgi:hypothetical protein